MKAIILGKKTVGRKETLEYASKKFLWEDCVIGISCYFGFWAWVLGRILRKKVIYYCIDFYSPKIADNFFDGIFIRLAMLMDKFLVRHVDEVWDISARIQKGRWQFGHYYANFNKIVPLSYPPSYFRFSQGQKDRIVFVGLSPYGLELLPDNVNFEWLGKDKLLPLPVLLGELSLSGIGVSLWKENGNNFYGDPGKTKLYSACGLPVIMTDNTPYAEIIKETGAGIVVPYEREEVIKAVKKIIENYDYYKNNVVKTWQYIDANCVFSNVQRKNI